MLRVLVVDNYDSFTFNLVQYLRELGATVRVAKNDAIDVEGIERDAPDGLLLSPGPCTPDDAGICLEAVRRLSAELPILGVCLGHQAIAQAFGARIVKADRLLHGKTSPIRHDDDALFRGLPSPFDGTRYHSLLVERATLPSCLVVTAWTDEGEIMALRHRERPCASVQFHPESILTPDGKTIVANWLGTLRAR
ncbi:MAG TPA: aminodeoxychorismate/anthranilate synthase component II [Polyangiaceae bacterium]